MEQTISDLQEQVRIYHSVKETGSREFLSLNFFADLSHAVPWYWFCTCVMIIMNLYYLKKFCNAKLAFQTFESAIKNTTSSFLFLSPLGLFCLFFTLMLDWYVPVLILLKRLDQGHLHSKLDVRGLTCLGRESNPGLRGGRRVLWKRANRTACQ